MTVSGKAHMLYVVNIRNGGKYNPNSFTAFIYTDLAKTIILLRTQKTINLAIKADHLFSLLSLY